MNSSINKIIHCLWLDFENLEDEKELPEKFNLYINRLKKVNPNWHFSIWNWKYIKNTFKDHNWLLTFIQNKNIGPTYKADCIRFHLVERYGGVWIDISTYVIQSFDELIKNYDCFSTVYIPTVEGLIWSIKPYSDITNDRNVEFQYDKLFNRLKDKVEVKDNKFDFLAENYFFMSPKNHPILKNVLNQLDEVFYKSNLYLNINSKDNFCKEMNKIVHNLIIELYDIDYPLLLLLENNLDYYRCARLFQYFQLTKSIKFFSKENSLSPKYIELNKSQKTLKQYIIDNIENNKKRKEIDISNLSDEYKNIIENNKTGQKNTKFTDYLCSYKACQKIIIHDSDDIPKVCLYSATWLRLYKYSSHFVDRITWINTNLGNKIDEYNPYFPNKSNSLKNDLINNQIIFLKTSAWTRESTYPYIKKLDKIINEEEEKENIYNITNIKRSVSMPLNFYKNNYNIENPFDGGYNKNYYEKYKKYKFKYLNLKLNNKKI
jgi:hypothetical protein